ncbi:protein FAM189A2 isoform X2 [Cyanistes caeruleus]|uniref:protein FAM189A2 isoform X2 n=1 Tax=Cyanistes caeruleus TaxID=156563 RepID=UPI000CDB5D29|nr:protein FAM189A2 isoform X2 [Cyanistes caeruleus]XP_023800624.1 protein FAM189A2 isoform X2 [Cyanistes caeruleus]XP_023800625.1 protein FAM189A2 isoform X2 [Cyanistes caeruleus]XP_023800626.1 protein FAM189A2 isoform X2 [Cyanistes caeruleus]XP_023800627.1 protein FAM189A2 isoform X2 [Cyanistes caeruleus]
MGSIFSFLTQSRPPKGIDRATETEWNCPICRDARDDLAYVVPCLHQFCLACIMRWAEMQRVCPLCREVIEAVRFSVQTDSYIDCVFTSSEESANGSTRTAITLGQLVKNSPFVQSPSRTPRGILSIAEHGGTGTQPVGGLPPRAWAELFQRDEHLLDPVVPWLRQELEAKYGTRWWMARIAESIILHAVSICGPARNVLAHVLEDFLEEHTEPLIDGVISIIVNECTQEAQRLLHSRAVSENNPVSLSSRLQMENTAPHPTPASTSAASSEELQPQSTSETVLHTLHPSTPIPAEQEELGEEAVAEEPAREEDNSTVAISTGPQEDNIAPQATPTRNSAGSSMEQPSISEAVLHTLHPSAPVPAEQEEVEPAAVSDPSAQDDRQSLFTPSQGRDPLPRRPQRSTRRRAASHLDSPQPCKRPPDQQQ